MFYIEIEQISKLIKRIVNFITDLKKNYFNAMVINEINC